VQIRRADNGNAAVDNGRSAGNSSDYTITVKTGFDGTNSPRYANVDKSKVQALKTPNGEVYGFVYNGEVYLDETVLNANTTIHEYTHLWDTAMQQVQPELWAKCKERTIATSSCIMKEVKLNICLLRVCSLNIKKPPLPSN